MPEPSRCDATAADPYWTPIDLSPGGVGFVGSYEHDVMLEVARSVTITL